MKKETLNNLIRVTNHKPVLPNVYVNDFKKAIKFIKTLVAHGVPLKQISTTDYNSNDLKIYVTIPYGNILGGSYAVYKRFSNTDIKSAIKFYKRNT